ncbi:AarF/ABC1/UbiB kinase family protein [Modestobacter sp. VKM Ac-2983]|uniref:ABC1 kinase family protein n=1 Tax=Modestobacter sp. VKM Ac-2983 TaxID=3004137 RepID=UPI0022ABA9D2|nr:AarF/ABC1/UbiB kinase family protein [Modestobacter sp. VKM Ac-2983]MCZ2806584.1 AarF/ABC1/UbiB kinase family protein [Modestobacter sp. VKM Ac-2983]
MSDTGRDIPRGAVSRTARLAALPLGAAGRATLGIGKRLSGRDAEEVSAELQQQTAEQLFAVLGQLKGGAMKLGQQLSIFEAAVPEEMAGPYREALVKLQEAAPPMPIRTVHAVLAQQLGGSWRERFRDFDDTPAAAASIGQVHRATWRDGRDVAVKIQYPGAGTALMADLNQLARFARMFAVLFPGMEVKPLIAELKARAEEELDYGLEADAQRTFAAAYADDEQIVVPRVVASAPKVIVSEWLEGVPLSQVITNGTREERDRAGLLMAVLHFSGPQRAGLLHADPHPGNYRLVPDGRLGVIDFGATARLPGGHPEPIGRLVRWALEGRAEDVLADLRAEGFVRENIQVDAQGVLDFLLPFLAPVSAPSFQFNRAWIQEQANRIGDPRSDASRLGRQLNLPPAYLLIHRVTMGSIAVLCQLDAEAPYRGVCEEWLPGFAG